MNISLTPLSFSKLPHERYIHFYPYTATPCMMKMAIVFVSHFVPRTPSNA